MGTTIKNPQDWANAFLGALGMPDSKTNVSNVVAWEEAEGGNWNNNAKYNPLNTSQKEPGSTSIGGGSKVQAYTSWQQGLDATTATLEQGGYGYPQILADLNTSQPWIDFKRAVSASGWDGSSHYKGNSVFDSSTAPSGNTSSGAYNLGANATTSTNTAENKPGKGAANLTGFAGILQMLQGIYDPSLSQTTWGFIPNIPGDISSTITMIFVRGTSALLSVLIIGIGVSTLIHGESSGGGSSSSGPTNVLEFINASQQGNIKLGHAERRLQVAEAHEARLQDEHNRKYPKPKPAFV